MLSSDAEVIRDGKKSTVPASELVPGDVVALATGDRVPADLRMIQVSSLVTSCAVTGAMEFDCRVVTGHSSHALCIDQYSQRALPCLNVGLSF